MTPTDDLAAVVRDEAERCGVDVRELARVLLGWTAEEMQYADGWLSTRRQLTDMNDRARLAHSIVHDDALLLAAPGGDESGR